MDNKDYIRVLLYSYYTAITGWGVLLNDNVSCDCDMQAGTTVLSSTVSWKIRCLGLESGMWGRFKDQSFALSPLPSTCSANSSAVSCFSPAPVMKA